MRVTSGSTIGTLTSAACPSARHRQPRTAATPSPASTKATSVDTRRVSSRRRPVALRRKRKVHHQPIAARLVDGHEVIATELLRRHRAATRERMVAMARRDERLRQQRLELERQLVAARDVEAELGLAVRNRGQHGIGALVDDAHANARETPGQLAQHGRQEVMHGRRNESKRRRPQRFAATSRTPSRISSRSSSSVRALRAKSRPTAVSSTLRVSRSNRRTPKASSSFSMRLLNAGCDR